MKQRNPSKVLTAGVCGECVNRAFYRFPCPLEDTSCLTRLWFSQHSITFSHSGKRVLIKACSFVGVHVTYRSYSKCVAATSQIPFLCYSDMKFVGRSNGGGDWPIKWTFTASAKYVSSTVCVLYNSGKIFQIKDSYSWQGKISTLMLLMGL